MTGPRQGDTLHVGRKWMVAGVGSLCLPGAPVRCSLTTETRHGPRTITVNQRVLNAYIASRGGAAYWTRPGHPESLPA